MSDGKIMLQLKAIHFKFANFTQPCECAITLAAYEMFHTVHIGEGIYDISIDDLSFKHDRYDSEEFKQDYYIAKSNNFDDTVIRTIELHSRKLWEYGFSSRIPDHLLKKFNDERDKQRQ